MISMICGIFFVFSGALASPLANQYIDSVLYGPLQQQLRAMSLEPAALQDFGTEFYDKIPIFGKVKGIANYTGGNLTGLSKVQRYSECASGYSFGYSIINCTISFYNLVTDYNCKLKYGKVPTVSVKAHSNISTSTVFMEIASTPGSAPSLRKFQVQQVGKMTTKFTGLGSPFNKFLKVLEDSYQAHVSGEFFNSINSRFQYALNIAASQVQMPV